MPLIDLNEIFRNKTFSQSRLISAGFAFSEGEYRKDFMIGDGAFVFTAFVAPSEKVRYTLIDYETGEEYALIHSPDAQGAFVNEIRAQCEAVLMQISEEAFDCGCISGNQSKRIISYIAEKLSVQPEFLWERTPGCAAFRRADNRKWFAVFMTVDEEKIRAGAKGKVEIFDLKANPEEIESLLAEKTVFPAFHMNKNHWFTIQLDGSLADERIFKWIDKSYRLAK